MDRKGGSREVAVSAHEIRAALSAAKTLSSEEEKALRMRHGAKVDDLRAPLPRAAGASEALADELLVIEMQLLRAFRASQASRPGGIRNPSKDKIVRALRKKR